MLTADAVIFMLCCFGSFWSFKTGNPASRRVLRWIIDGMFVLALVIMAGVCTVIAYAIA